LVHSGARTLMHFKHWSFARLGVRLRFCGDLASDQKETGQGAVFFGLFGHKRPNRVQCLPVTVTCSAAYVPACTSSAYSVLRSQDDTRSSKGVLRTSGRGRPVVFPRSQISHLLLPPRCAPVPQLPDTFSHSPSPSPCPPCPFPRYRQHKLESSPRSWNQPSLFSISTFA